jgi:uncharacterized membrane protein
LRSLTFVVAFLGGAPLAGCHKVAADRAAEAALNRAAVIRSLDRLERKLGELESRFAALRTQVEAVAPDPAGGSQLRAQFYSTEEARGITNVKVTLIANRLASTAVSRRPDELRQISKDIAETYDEIRQIDELQTSLSNRAHALQRVGGRNDEARPGARTR